MRILLVYWRQPLEVKLSSIEDNINSLKALSNDSGEFVLFNAFPNVCSNFDYSLFDVIIFHSTFLALRYNYNIKDFVDMYSYFRKAKSYKIAMPQDEYDCSVTLDKFCSSVQVNLVCTNFILHTKALYPNSFSTCEFIECFTGYVSQSLLDYSKENYQAKQFHIGYRGSVLGDEFGLLGKLKSEVPILVRDKCIKAGLLCDIQVGGEYFFQEKEWYNFLLKCNAFLGFESGSSLVVGSINEKLAGSFFAVDGLNTISPRHLECAILQVPQILLEGSYKGFFHPNIHYIELKKDLSNLDEIIHIITREPEKLKRVAENAFKLIINDNRFYYDTLISEINEKLCLYSFGNKSRNQTRLISIYLKVRFRFESLKSVLSRKSLTRSTYIFLNKKAPFLLNLLKYGVNKILKRRE